MILQKRRTRQFMLIGLVLGLIGTMIPVVIVFQLKPQLPKDVDTIARQKASAYYARRYDQIVNTQILHVTHPQTGDSEDLWCFSVQMIGQRQNATVTETTEWFASKRQNNVEWYVSAFEMLEYPFPYMQKCGISVKR